ncbi:MAG: hypothetical protein MHMPM18_000527 [Marteilia pararefringens]
MSEKDESSTSLVKPRFEIVKWNAVFLWKYKDVLDDCAICRNSLNDVCNYCQQAFLEEDDLANNIPEGKKFKEWLKCDLTWGKCSIFDVNNHHGCCKLNACPESS